MRVLVTGHHGYIGSVMAPYLKKRGFDVTGLDVELFDGECAFMDDPENIPEIKKDIRDVQLSDLEGFDAVVHLAAICNDPLGNLNSEWTYDINHRGTVHLAKVAKQAGVKRFLLSSSCSMHGKSSAGKVTEETPVHPITPYGESKIMAERDLGDMADENFSPTYLRNGTVYGVSPRHRVDIVLNNLAGWASTSNKIRVMSDGEPWRPVVHIEDVSQAFAVVLEADREKVHHQAFHVGADFLNIQIKDLAQTVHDLLPGSSLEFGQEEDADQRTYIADFSKIAQVLPEFKPKYGIEAGAKELLEAYQKSGLKSEDMTGDRFVRLGRIKKLLDENKLDDNMRLRK